MAAKKIDIKFDIDNKAVKIAGEETMKLSQQVRLLKAELASGKYSQEEFELLATKLGDVQDQMAKSKARAGDLFTSLQLIPGPVGAIASQINGAIGLMKTFGDFSFKDLKFQFKETFDDIKEIGSALGNNLGITQTYTRLNEFLTTSFTRMGIAQQGAAAGARAFSAALTATGIGAIVVALGLLVANWDKVKDAIMGATAESKTYEEAQADVTKELTDFNKKLFDVEIAFKKAKDGSMSKRDALKKYNDTLGTTVGFAGSLEQAEQLLAENTSVVVEGIKLRTQANVFYAKSAEAAAKAVSGEDLDPTVWQTIGDYILAGGQYSAFASQQIGSYAKNLKETQDNVKRFEEEGDKLTEKALENDKKLKKGLATPPDFSETKKENKSTLDDYLAGLEEARLVLMDEQDKEEKIVNNKYDKLRQLAIENKKDTTEIEKARTKELQVITDKYTKIENDKNAKRVKDEREVVNKIDQINASRTETLLDDAEVEVRIVEQKYDEMKALAEQEGRDVVEIERLKQAEIAKIRGDAAAAETKRVDENTQKTREKEQQDLQAEIAIEQQRLAIKMQAVDGIIQLAGEETAIGRAALIAKQALLAQELILEVKRTIFFGKESLRRSLIATAEGAANTSKSGFPNNIPLLLLYAVQAATIISNVRKAIRGEAGGLDKAGAAEQKAGMDSQPPSSPPPIQVVARRSQGGFVNGRGGSITDSIPAMLSNGEFVMNARSSSMFSPILTAMNDMGNLPTTQVPNSFGNQTLIEAVSQGMNSRPIKTYVTAQDMSNQQQFDRTIKSRSLI